MSCLGRPYQFKIWLSSKNFTWFIFEYIEPCNNYILKMKNDLTYHISKNALKRFNYIVYWATFTTVVIACHSKYRRDKCKNHYVTSKNQKIAANIQA